MWWILWILLVAIILILATLYALYLKDKKHFTNRGVPYLGNVTYDLLLGLLTGVTLPDNIIRIYKEGTRNHPGRKFFGTTEFGTLSFMITDLDLIKRMAIKDFDHFVDRRHIKFPKKAYLMAQMLVFLTGGRWKAMRTKMSPTFTTGKIRRMFKIFDDSSKKLVTYIEKEMKEFGQIDLNEGYSKFTMDVIGSAAFGIDSKTFEQRGSSVIEQMTDELGFSFRALFFVIFPRLTEFLGLSPFTKDPMGFFSGTIKAAISHREASGEKRDDFIQLMLEARDGKSKLDESELNDFEKSAIMTTTDTSGSKLVLEDDDIAAQCVLFILAGHETTTSLLNFMAYALALDPEVQERLYQEVLAAAENNNGELTYDSVNTMEYMDMVVNETLRLYTPVPSTDRACTKEYKIPDTDFIIKKGEAVVFPSFGIHRDDKYFPEPEKFDPERFSSHNRSKLHPCAFIPFGFGPRNCIGMRFALSEAKLAISRLLLEFSFEPCEKTLIPMKFINGGSLKPKGGMWLKLNKRASI